MINQSNEPSIGTSEPGKKDWGKRGGIALAVVLIVFGALSFVQVATGVDVWHYLWPLIPIALGAGILAERGGWF
jgi:hypothetical protein